MSNVRDDDSLRAHVARLPVGESLSRAVRVEFGGLLGAKMMKELGDSLRKTLQSACHRAKQDNPDAEYRVDTGKFFTRDDCVMICVVVTREA